MKPDWATRLQRTFARKYDAGFAKGLMFGKAVATRDEQDRIVKLLEDMDGLDDWYQGTIDKPDGPYIDRKYAIALIKGENKPFITAKQAEQLTDEMLEE